MSNNKPHMEKQSKTSKASITRTATIGRVPGPMEEAAVRVYYERGSKQSIERNMWRITALGSMGISLLMGGALVLLLPLKSVETIQINKDQAGRVSVQNVDAQRFTADDDVKMAWANDWVSNLTEINGATWKRSIEQTAAKSIATAIDQVRDYLAKDENQPAQILYEKPLYIREFSRQSINMLSPNVVLLRYSLTSRPAPGAPKVVKSYAMTITLATVKPRSRDEVVSNPSGLAVQNFSISEELGK